MTSRSRSRSHQMAATFTAVRYVSLMEIDIAKRAAGGGAYGPYAFGVEAPSVSALAFVS